MLKNFSYLAHLKPATCALALTATLLGQAAAQVATTATITELTTFTSTVDPTQQTVPGGGSPGFPTEDDYNLNYGWETLGITSFTTGTGLNTTTYNPITYGGTITTTLVRVSSPLGTNQNNNILYQRLTGSGTNPYPIAGPFDGSQESAFNSNNLNIGTDNLFGNTGGNNGNNNNIERVDVVFNLGLTVTDVLAFIVLERGTTSAHDGFKIAAILAVDINGTPTEYGSVIDFAQGSYGTTNLLSSDTDWLVLRNDASDANGPAISPSAFINNQAIGGTTISVAGATSENGLGIATDSTIYGYSLFAYDVTATTSAELLDVMDNTLFPKDTPSDTGAGGIDLIAYTGVAVNAVPEPSIVGLMAIAGALGVIGRRRRRGMAS